MTGSEVHTWLKAFGPTRGEDGGAAVESGVPCQQDDLHKMFITSVLSSKQAPPPFDLTCFNTRRGLPVFLFWVLVVVWLPSDGGSGKMGVVPLLLQGAPQATSRPALCSPPAARPRRPRRSDLAPGC